ncbi:MAG: enoyl-CoA hydratase [Hyphomicrobiaceae bacterium]
MTDANLHVKTTRHKGVAGVALVTIDNPARLNCLGRSTINALRAAFEALSDDQALRAVVLTGAGDRAFIGGADLRELGACDADGARLFITDLQRCCAAIRDCPVPVVARIDGFCLGAGLEIAVSCDLRYASARSTFGMPEVHMGLPSVIEAALLPRLIGWGRTCDLLYTGRTFEAPEALEMGLIEASVGALELDATVDAAVSAIVGAAPEAIRSQKRLMRRWERGSLEEGVLAGIHALSEAYVMGEPQARIAAFFEARRQKKAAP